MPEPEMPQTETPQYRSGFASFVGRRALSHKIIVGNNQPRAKRNIFRLRRKCRPEFLHDRNAVGSNQSQILAVFIK